MHIVEFMGLMPYFWCFYEKYKARERASFHMLIPLIVGINGFQYHILFTDYALSRAIDMLIGLYIISYVNYYTTLQPAGLVVTGTVLTGYAVNLYMNSGLFHVVFLQQPFLIYYMVAPIEDKYKCLL